MNKLAYKRKSRGSWFIPWVSLFEISRKIIAGGKWGIVIIT